MEYGDLCTWSRLWMQRKENSHRRYGDIFLEPNEKIHHPLNVLYDLKCGYDKKGTNA